MLSFRGACRDILDGTNSDAVSSFILVMARCPQFVSISICLVESLMLGKEYSCSSSATAKDSTGEELE